MNILFIGDIVGSVGREMLASELPSLRKQYNVHVTIINGENAAAGKGITEPIYKEFMSLGVNAVTMGNHTWDKKEIFDFIDSAKSLVRPANFPEGVPGEGLKFIKYQQLEIAVINLQGRVFLPAIDCPFKKIDQLIEIAKKRTHIIFVDFHAEATSEKQAFAWYVDGQVTSVVGTHTHVQTNDARILPQGTSYITDVGMTGPRDGILGMNREVVIQKFLNALPNRFEVEKGSGQLNAVVIAVDEKTGKATKIETIHLYNDRIL